MKKLLLTLVALYALHPALAMEIDERQIELDCGLYRAILHGDLTRAKECFAAGAAIEEETGALYHPTTALILAVEKGYLPMCKLLLDHGANPNAHAEMGGYTALIFAAAAGGTNRCKLLLEKQYGTDVNAIETGGRTALMFAAMNGRAEACKAILEMRPDVDLEVECKALGATALIHAIRHEKLELCKLLLAAGASVQKKQSVLEQAIRYGTREICELLIAHNVPRETTLNWNHELIFAAQHASPEACALFLERGANILATNADGETALIGAAHARNWSPDERTGRDRDPRITDFDDRLEEACHLLLDCQKEREKRMLMLLASLKHSDLPVAKLLYRQRKELLAPYLGHYLLHKLLSARNLSGKNAHDYWPLDWLKPL